MKGKIDFVCFILFLIQSAPQAIPRLHIAAAVRDLQVHDCHSYLLSIFQKTNHGEGEARQNIKILGKRS